MNMMYKTVVIDCAPKAKKMAAAIEKKTNELAQAGWEPVTFSVTNSAKVILLFRLPENALPEHPVLQETVEAVDEAE